MKTRLLVLLVAASVLSAGCGDNGDPIPAVCDVQPSFIDFGQVLAPLEANITMDVDQTVTILNQVYTNSDRGNANLAGEIAIHGPDGPGNLPEIRIVPAPEDSTFLLQPRAGKQYTIRATVRSDTRAGTYSGFVSLGLECGDIPFVVRVYVREDTPPKIATVISRYGDEDGQLNRPTRITVDEDGWLYVLEDTKRRLQIFDDTGTFWRAWYRLRDIDGVPVPNTDFDRPSDVAIGPDGNVNLADIGRSHIYLFRKDALFIKDWGYYLKPPSPAFETPYAIAVNSAGHVLVADRTLNQVLEFDISELQPQILVRKWGSHGPAPGQFGYPSDIEVDSQDNVYIADWEYNVIHKFSPTGEFITRWGKEGSFIGEFDRPLGIGLDAEDNVYVCDSSNARIQKFDSNGQFLTVWGERGPGPLQFGLPADVAIGPDGRIFIVDKGNGWILVYRDQAAVVPAQ